MGKDQGAGKEPPKGHKSGQRSGAKAPAKPASPDAHRSPRHQRDFDNGAASPGSAGHRTPRSREASQPTTPRSSDRLKAGATAAKKPPIVPREGLRDVSKAVISQQQALLFAMVVNEITEKNVMTGQALHSLALTVYKRSVALLVDGGSKYDAVLLPDGPVGTRYLTHTTMKCDKMLDGATIWKRGKAAKSFVINKLLKLLMDVLVLSPGGYYEPPSGQTWAWACEQVRRAQWASKKSVVTVDLVTTDAEAAGPGEGDDDDDDNDEQTRQGEGRQGGQEGGRRGPAERLPSG